MFEAIILAGGYSSRMGRNKMELELDGKPVLSWTVDAFKHQCSRILVVGGHYYEAIEEMMKDEPLVEVVRNENYNRGMFSSVLRGISQVKGSCFVCPGDYPLLDPETIKILAECEGDFVVPVFQGRRGHPVLLNPETVEKLKQAPDDWNLKGFRETCDLMEVEVSDPGILQDIDNPEDFEYALKRRKEWLY